MSCLLIEPWDFSKPLYGNGCASVCDSAIRTLGTRLKIVGVTSDGIVGRWTKTVHHGVEFDFFPLVHLDRVKKPRFFSSNAEVAIALARQLPAIRQAGISAVFTGTYSILWVLTFFSRGWDICFYYPGLANPLAVGKRQLLGAVLAPLYDRIQARAVGRATIAFAPASRPVVKDYNRMLRDLDVKKEVLYQPTAVDLETFRPRPIEGCRQQLGIPAAVPVFTFVGRLASVKGIPFLIKSLKEVHHRDPKAMLLLVGEGEQRDELESLVRNLKLEDRVKFLGRRPPAEVALAIGSANACVVGSFQEGFSVSMVEQIACGRPIVTTAVSGSDELIIEGKNGFIVQSREPAEFAKRMLDVLNLPEAERVSRELAEQHYSEKNLWQRMADAWPPLR